MATELARIIRSLADGTSVDPRDIREVLADDADTAEAAVSLAQEVDALRRRSAELRAVMSSTRDLLAIPDADLMLQRIVDRAHELMDVDVAYLSVYDPAEDQLHVRAQTGTISPRFFGMVVPAGVGLASLAVRTQRPQWVADYASLTSVPHDATIDAIMQEEQLRSLLGAPLVVGGNVLGVLFAASRQPHEFRPEEISLLSAFAGHAALVLHLARLLKDATEASADAASRQQDAEWAASLHEELIRLVVFGHGTDDVVGALSEALGRSVAFVDDEGRMLVGAEDIPLRGQLRAAADEAAATGRSVRVADGTIELVAPVVATTARSGALLVARGEQALTPIERRTVERSALITALVMLRHNALADAEERVRGEVAAEILDGTSARADGLRRADARGYVTTGAWTIAVVPCALEDRARVLSRLRARADWLSAPAASGVAVLAPTASRSEADDQIRERADTEAARVQQLVGAGAPLVLASVCDGLGEAADMAPDLWQTARLALGLGIGQGAIDAATLAPYAALFDGDGLRLAAFVDSMLAPVKDWDRAHGAELMQSLAALFDERWSLTAAARSLHIHLNTMKQRMQRLRALLGDDLDRPESRFRLELALRIENARVAAKGT